MSVLGTLHSALRLKKYEMIGRGRKIAELPVNVPVDFVVPWVDDTDEVWRQDKSRFANPEIKGNGVERYRDWGQFLYWFRAVEQYAPWVRKIHLITYGHVPSWLNQQHEELHIVRHSDFMPQEYLPVFSVNPIELNLHRIEGLSEHFVYFNDDVYLNRPVTKEDFFSGELPKYCGASVPLKNYGYNGPFAHMMLSNLGLINEHFDVYERIENHPERWFNKQYKAYWKYHRWAYRENYLFGMYYPHLGSPMRKSTMQKVWDAFPEELDATCRRRFRSALDVQQQIFHLWDIMSGEYDPVGTDYYGRHFGHLSTQMDEVERAFSEGKCRMICPNDSVDITNENYEQIKKRLDEILSKKFPEKSSYEL